jgi:hypothetical protein
MTFATEEPKQILSQDARSRVLASRANLLLQAMRANQHQPEVAFVKDSLELHRTRHLQSISLIDQD